MNVSSIEENKVDKSCKKSIVKATKNRIAQHADIVLQKAVSDVFFQEQSFDFVQDTKLDSNR